MKNACIELGVGVLAGASAVGKKEYEGPLGACFDLHDPCDRFGGDTWEASESEMQRMALNLALGKAGLCDRDIDALFAGDLLNQCIGSAYGLLSFDIPYFGLYGACSTSAEGLMLASVAVAQGGIKRAAVVTSSHFCAAERQYRTPIEYGAQRAPTAQWTVTGAGAFLLENTKHAQAVVQRGMPGRAVERGIGDAANMGAAMAPAAEDTLTRWFKTTKTRPEDYDLIVTGDLGHEGGAILCDLMRAAGYPMEERYTDCGILIFDKKTQDTHAGGSGCGCSATVLASHFLPKLKSGEIKRMLFGATGAMMSPDALKQGNAIPAIAHLLELTAPKACCCS